VPSNNLLFQSNSDFDSSVCLNYVPAGTSLVMAFHELVADPGMPPCVAHGLDLLEFMLEAQCNNMGIPTWERNHIWHALALSYAIKCNNQISHDQHSHGNANFTRCAYNTIEGLSLSLSDVWLESILSYTDTVSHFI